MATFTVFNSHRRLPSGCDVHYSYHVPASKTSNVLVVVGHGFGRTHENMSDLVEHIASWGMTTVALDFCHRRPTDADHRRNADDMIDLARSLGTGPVIYVGHSTGGLAAFIAARYDTNAVAVLGLDMVDSDRLAWAVAPHLSVPAFGLIGEPSVCNDNNNCIGAYRNTRDFFVTRVIGATPCHFESPSDALCPATCGRPADDANEAALRRRIISLATACLAWQTGIDENAASLWEPGQFAFDRLVEAGEIEAVE